jgi:hypothetical protein
MNSHKDKPIIDGRLEIVPLWWALWRIEQEQNVDIIIID